MACFALVTLAGAGAARSEPWVTLSAGGFEVGRDRSAVEAGIASRTRPGRWGLSLAGGVSGTGDGAVWAWAGLQREFEPAPRWVVIPGLGVALFEEGDGKDLGGPVEFRSSIELARAVGERARVGLLFYHLSNAGLYDLNPGANSLVLTYSWSLP